MEGWEDEGWERWEDGRGGRMRDGRGGRMRDERAITLALRKWKTHFPFCMNFPSFSCIDLSPV